MGAPCEAGGGRHSRREGLVLQGHWHPWKQQLKSWERSDPDTELNKTARGSGAGLCSNSARVSGRPGVTLPPRTTRFKMWPAQVKVTAECTPPPADTGTLRSRPALGHREHVGIVGADFPEKPGGWAVPWRSVVPAPRTF